MSIIRKGRRKVAKKKIIFVCCFLSVVLIGSVCFIVNYEKLFPKKEIIVIPSFQGAVVVRNIAKGEVLEQKDINSITLSGKYENLNILSIQEAIGSKVKEDLSANTILSKDMLESDKRIAKDLRKHAYHFIEMTDQLSQNDYVDIRIQFPNGADYIVLSKKRVLACSLYNEAKKTDNSLWLEVSEKDILLLSSAIIDAYYDDKVKIYAIQYVAHDQESAIVTYPENDIVHTLLKEDPNIVNRAEEIVSERIRERVTMRLREYANKAKYEQTDQEQDSKVYYEDDNYVIDTDPNESVTDNVEQNTMKSDQTQSNYID